MSKQLNQSFSKTKLEVKPANISKLNLKELNSMINELKKLCETLDPYSGANAIQLKVLKKYHIPEHTAPFTMTNKLLVLMEDAIEQREELLKKARS